MLSSIVLYLLIVLSQLFYLYILFFFNDTATTEIYTLSLHDALPIFDTKVPGPGKDIFGMAMSYPDIQQLQTLDRKSTRLNSSHVEISYAVFCLKKKKKKNIVKNIVYITTCNVYIYISL